MWREGESDECGGRERRVSEEVVVGSYGFQLNHVHVNGITVNV